MKLITSHEDMQSFMKVFAQLQTYTDLKRNGLIVPLDLQEVVMNNLNSRFKFVGCRIE